MRAHVVTPLFPIYILLILTRPCVANATPQHLDITVRPPQAGRADHHRGFPAVVSIHELGPDPSHLTSRIARLLRHGAPEVQVTERYHVVDLLGGITRIGEYYTQIFMGGQPVRVQIDTGSSTLALPLAECSNCLRGDLRYNMRLSQTRGKARWVSCTNALCRPDMCGAHKCKHCSARDACCASHNPAACGFALRYGDHSYARGALLVDDMTWGRNLTAPVVFGGILDDSATFERASVDGILGLAYRALACNPTCVEPPFQQLVAAGKVEDSFSICISGSGGRLVLGGMDESLKQGPMIYAPLALSEVPSYYTVNVTNQLKIGDRSLSLPYFRSAIVDSGTTLLVVRAVVFELITEHFKRHYCNVRGLCDLHSWFRPAACAPLTDDDIAKLPTLVFTVKPGVVIELRADDYMIHYHQKGRSLRCLGIMGMPKLSHGTDAIFGNTVMQRYVTHYDRANKRMGFAMAKQGCGKSICEDLSTCFECAAQDGCSFNFGNGKCSKDDTGIGLVPYPRCRGSNCFCRLGTQTGLIFGSVAGFVGTFVVFALAILLMALYGRRDGDTAYQAAGREDETEVALFEQGEQQTKRDDTTSIIT